MKHLKSTSIGKKVKREITDSASNYLKEENVLELEKLPVFIIPPHIPDNYPLRKYPWYLKISIESKLDFSKIELLRQEFMFQFRFEKKLTNCFENLCQIKKIVSYREDDLNVHIWYLGFEETEPSLNNILDFDELNKERAIDFDLIEDSDWNEISPLLDRLRASFRDYTAIAKQEYFRHQLTS